MKCGSCGFEAIEVSSYCPSCGSLLASAGGATQTVAVAARTPGSRPRMTSSTATEGGRFLPGTLLAGRYRVIALLGKGGMGEVYRADDLTLAQPVALKFLPESAARDEATLARFHNEVRIARQVSHPNVCRVYDLGEVEGQSYLTMEYVDGEDLGALLRRIGRLPSDKALEIARKLCAGLAAAHDRGVLHRDLKPANIMLDGRGEVLITDFGLAGLAGQILEAEIRNGTPAYMAPEQLAGREVSVRSDLYSLGLVLYEIFTGKRAFEASTLAELVRLQSSSVPMGPSALVKELDPAVERIILRCLEPDPAQRPASALAIAAALPGGDPLAAALAAGETPSPQMVAAAGETAGLAPRVAVPCLAGVILGLVAVIVLGSRGSMLEKVQPELSADVLQQKAREWIQLFGYSARPVDSERGFTFAGGYVRYIEEHEKPSHWSEIASGQPSPLRFQYRESPRPLVAGNLLSEAARPGMITLTDPPPILSGMITVEMDHQGRLISLEAMPPQREEPPGKPQPFDWNVLFRAAGLDPARFQPAEPAWTGLGQADTRAAWTGSYPGAPAQPLRVEAAAWRGKPVFFASIGAWSKPSRMQAAELSAARKASNLIFLTMLVVVLIVAALLARRNYVQGKGDRHGSLRLAFWIVCIQLLAWLCSAHLFASVDSFSGSFVVAAGVVLSFSFATWMLYMALEPYVRRHWPQTIISWSRILAGRPRDPLMGSHILFGIVLGVAWAVLFELRHIVLMRAGAAPAQPALDYLLGWRRTLGACLWEVTNSVQSTLVFFFVLFTLRVVLRRQWLAAAGFVVFFTVAQSLRSANLAVEFPFRTLIYMIAAFMLVRFGLVTLTAGIYTVDILLSAPLTTNLSTWYAGAALFAPLSILALAVYGFHTALAGQPLFKEELFE